MPQCSHPPHSPCHQRCLANCVWMSVSYTSGQPSHPRRRPTCWSSSQRSHPVTSTPCNGAWTSVLLSANLFTGWDAWHIKSNHPFVLGAQRVMSSSDDNRKAGLWNVDCGVFGENCETPYFHPRHRRLPSWNGLATKSVGPANPPPQTCRKFPLLLT